MHTAQDHTLLNSRLLNSQLVENPYSDMVYKGKNLAGTAFPKTIVRPWFFL